MITNSKHINEILKLSLINRNQIMFNLNQDILRGKRNA